MKRTFAIEYESTDFGNTGKVFVSSVEINDARNDIPSRQRALDVWLEKAYMVERPLRIVCLSRCPIGGNEWRTVEEVPVTQTKWQVVS